MGIVPESFGGWLDDLANGIIITVLITLVGALCALVLAFILGLMARMKSLAVRGFARVVIEFFRGTSLLIQLFWLYYVLPQLGYRLDAFAVAVVALALNFGAYGAEVVRGAINAIPREQAEATVALNMNAYQRMRRVILPQAIVGMIPPFGNLLIQLLKSTPLVYTITLVDITAVTQNYRDAEGHTLFIFSLSLVLYFVIAYAFTLIMNALEARAKVAAGVSDPRGKFSIWQLQRPGDGW
ncbi:MAG: ectoine/hydroxyectoine ABC transporter permease subunit EhuC [Streptosporangiales bacterium]